MGTYAGFVDAYYLKAEGARFIGKKATDKDVRLNAPYVVDWLRGLSQTQLHGARFLRAYWYEGAFDQLDDRYKKQREYLDAIAHHVQLRLGKVVEYPSRLDEPIHNALTETVESLKIPVEHFFKEFAKRRRFYERQQKGVDTLITLDMVRLARRSVFDTAVLISGDGDLLEVIRTVQDYGVRVLIVSPNPSRSVAREVAQLADDVIEIPKKEIKNMLTYTRQ